MAEEAITEIADWIADGAPGEGDKVEADIENVFGGNGDDLIIVTGGV